MSTVPAYTSLQSQLLSQAIGSQITVGSFTVLRIPGGWIWSTANSAVFVSKDDMDNK